MNKNLGGFSLIEALITLLVLTIGLLGLGQLQARLWTVAGDLHTREDAYLLGENLLEISPLTWLPVSAEQNLVKQPETAIVATLDRNNPTDDRSALISTKVNMSWHRSSGKYVLSLSTTVNTNLSGENTRWLLPPN